MFSLVSKPIQFCMQLHGYIKKIREPRDEAANAYFTPLLKFMEKCHY